MSKKFHTTIIITSVLAWLTLLTIQYLFLRNSYNFTSGKYLSEIAADITEIINPVEGENAPNDFLVQYADHFANTIHGYNNLVDVPLDSIPFHYPVLDSLENAIIAQVNKKNNNHVKFAIVMEQWGPIDDDNNYTPYQRLTPSINNKILGNLSSLEGAFSQSSFSSTENSVFFHVTAYFKYKDIQAAVLGKIKWQIALALLSFILLTGLLIWTLTRLFQLQREREDQIEFVDNIRHTFQTPLTTIGVASAAQMRYLAEGQYDDARKMGSYVHAQTARLQQIVDQLNNNSSFDLKEAISPRSISLDVFFEHCLEDMKIKYSNRPVNITINITPEDLQLIVDPFYFKTAILNILDNSFQYNIDDEELYVEIMVKRINDDVSIRISDNGIGVDHREHKNLGKKYYRPAQHSQITGLGLGLYQTTEIVKAHGGRIAFQGDTTAGFTVIITIPNDEE